MKLLDKSLELLEAEDLMSRDVVTVPAGMSLRAAARLLSRARVSGAPVVDETGRCVGVLSTSDFLKLAGHVPLRRGDSSISSDWQMLDDKEVPEDSVAAYMTPDPVTVKADTLLPDVARRMLDAHIHRVVVLDEEDRPIGVLSSTDVLAAVAQIGPGRG